MLPAYILSLREGVEAALVIGLLLGALRQVQRRELALFVWLGAASATLLSLAAAVLLSRLGLELKDPGEAIFEGLTMVLAASILTGMIFWMAGRSAGLRKTMETGVANASVAGKWPLFGLAFFAVLREGVELALFLAVTVFAAGAHQGLVGALLGLGSALLLGLLIFVSTIRLDLQRFFQVTGVFLILFAAGLMARAAGELTIAGWIPLLVPHIWNLGSYLSEESAPGQILAVLFGYSASPSLMQVLAYAGYFVTILAVLRLRRVGPARSARKS